MQSINSPVSISFIHSLIRSWSENEQKKSHQLHTKSSIRCVFFLAFTFVSINLHQIQPFHHMEIFTWFEREREKNLCWAQYCFRYCWASLAVFSRCFVFMLCFFPLSTIGEKYKSFKMTCFVIRHETRAHASCWCSHYVIFFDGDQMNRTNSLLSKWYRENSKK